MKPKSPEVGQPYSESGLEGAEVIRTNDSEAPMIVTGSREQLFHLLAEAAEIEHSLMCSYLYAAFSLRRKQEEWTAEQTAAVDRWRSAIMGVAIEEMGHLLILANLTTALGGRPHFARPNFPIAPGYFPSGVVVRLSGFSLETLEHFIFLERPKGSGDDDAACYEQDDYSRRQAHLGLIPNAQHYSTIGFLYEAIQENLTSLAEIIGEEELFVAPAAMQLAAPAIDLPGVERIHGVKGALKGIALIVEQGEGSPQDREDTHYRKFLSIRDEYRKMAEADPVFCPAWPVADNPVLRSPPDPEDKVFVEAPEAAALLDFTCATYGLLLRTLLQCFGDLPEGDQDRQGALFTTALSLMHVMGDCSSALAALPATSSGSVNAGISFTMLRGLEPFLAGTIGERMLVEQIKRLKEGAEHCRHVPTRARERLAATNL